MQIDSKIKLINRYLDQGMSDAEKQLFEENMSEDPSLLRAVEAQAVARNQAEKESLQNLFHSFHKELDELDRGGRPGVILEREASLTGKNGKFGFRKWSIPTMIFLIVIVISLWILFK